MTNPRRSWTVTPHDALLQHEENFWSIEGMVPGAPFRRRMGIVRRSDGTLAFFHAIPLEDEVLSQVAALGKPAFLVVGHHQHMIDAHPFAERLGLKVFGPKRVEAALRERCDLAGSLEEFPKDPAVSVESLPGSKLAEAVMVVKSGDRQSVLFCDAIQNNPASQVNFMFRLLGFAGGPKMPFVFRVLFLEDRRAMRAEFERLAALPGLKRIVPCHGTIVESGAAEALKAAAAAL
jgi:hypothetical protein